MGCTAAVPQLMHVTQALQSKAAAAHGCHHAAGTSEQQIAKSQHDKWGARLSCDGLKFKEQLAMTPALQRL